MSGAVVTDAVSPDNVSGQATTIRVIDALETITGALARLDFDDQQALADFDRIRPVLGTGISYRDLFSQTGINATPVLVAMVIVANVVGWASGGMELLLNQPGLPDVLGGQPEVRLVELAFACAGAVAEFHAFGASEPRRDACGRAFAALGRHLESMSSADNAKTAWVTASNFATSPGALLEAADELTRLASGTSDLAQVAMGLTRRAQAFTWKSEAEPDCRLAAFDAVFAALRHAGHAGSFRAAIGEGLALCIKYLDSAELRYLFKIVFSEDETGFMADLRHLVRGTWDLDPADLGRLEPHLRELTTRIENARFRLEPKQEDAMIHASWISWSFSHPKHHAVPYGQSIRIGERYDDLLLELGHEITHIFTMIGHLGLISAALRAAAVEIEIRLWADMGADSYADFSTLGMAPLTTTDVFALAQVEQSLEIIRKMQVLQATWAPWLEGVAVFGELAVDPREGETSTPISAVVANLGDTEPPEAGSQNVEDIFNEHHAQADREYADVQNRSGKYRLRTYLVDHRDWYLAGYLAVRGVVSAWRDAMDGHLSGSQAFEVLLHVTRFGTADAVPALDLPADEFALAASEGMLTWLDRLARVSAGDIRKLLREGSGSGSGFGWRDGHLFAGTQRGEDGSAEYNRYVAAAMSSLSGAERSPAGRVPDADETCQDVMRLVADRLALRTEPPEVAENLLHEFVDQMHILPLGSVSAPFWLISRDTALICTFRTTGARADTGEPGYSPLLVFPLDNVSYARLCEEVAANPGRRMMVHRFADLHPNDPGTPDRGFGRNLLVFQFGEWVQIWHRGLFTGAGNVAPGLAADIRDRLLPARFLETEQQLAAGKGAARVARWIDSVPAWTADDTVVLPVEPWARRVRALAGDVEQGAAACTSSTNAALLRRLYDAGTAQVLHSEGIRGLVDEASDVTPLMAALHVSGFGRGPDTWLSSLPEHSQLLKILQATTQGWDLNPISAR
jgi:hypothetical protein